MSVVKINALEIPPQAGDEIVKRFTARMNSLTDVGGFEGFELLRPTGDTETRWFVYTRWSDQASYEAWRDGDGARASHAQAPANEDGQGGPTQGGPTQGGPTQGDPSQGDDADAPRKPVSMGATLLEFEVEVSASASGV